MNPIVSFMQAIKERTGAEWATVMYFDDGSLRMAAHFEHKPTCWVLISPAHVQDNFEFHVETGIRLLQEKAKES